MALPKKISYGIDWAKLALEVRSEVFLTPILPTSEVR